MSKRLLLADDSITIQKVVNLTFADEGIEVVSVGDGDAAMLKFNESMPDLVLADVNMPGLDGYRMCEMIKQDEETKHIPVILLVGSFEPFDEQEAFRVGADDFLTKPFQSIRQLVTKVSDLLNGTAKSDDSSSSSAPESDIPALPQISNDWQYADTKEFPVELADTENLGDTGMDDEMIQTSQVGGEPASFDEVQNFISQSYTYRDESEGKSEQENLTEKSFQNEADEDFALLEPTAETESERIAAADAYGNKQNFDSKIYNLSDYENREVEAEAEEITGAVEIVEENNVVEQPEEAETPEENTIYAEEITESPTVSEWEFVAAEDEENKIEETGEGETPEIQAAKTSEAVEDETPKTETSQSEKTETSQSEIFDETANVEKTANTEESNEIKIEQEFAPPKTATMVTFDDLDFLELPPLVEETGIRPQAEKQESKPLFEKFAPEIENKQVAESAANDLAAQEISAQAFPPELIEAIAQKVAERISDKTIRDIAWEVVPQMTDLIVRRLAEEQLNKETSE